MICHISKKRPKGHTVILGFLEGTFSQKLSGDCPETEEPLWEGPNIGTDCGSIT